jgi:aryl-alcohol dehydrogenase-like predicted oxidoreductase
VLAQGEHIAPIPGTKHIPYLEDNMGAVDVSLSADELAQINDLFPPGAAQGERYAEPMMALVNR